MNHDDTVEQRLRALQAKVAEGDKARRELAELQRLQAQASSQQVAQTNQLNASQNTSGYANGISPQLLQQQRPQPSAQAGRSRVSSQNQTSMNSSGMGVQYGGIMNQTSQNRNMASQGMTNGSHTFAGFSQAGTQQTFDSSLSSLNSGFQAPSSVQAQTFSNNMSTQENMTAAQWAQTWHLNSQNQQHAPPFHRPQGGVQQGMGSQLPQQASQAVPSLVAPVPRHPNQSLPTVQTPQMNSHTNYAMQNGQSQLSPNYTSTVSQRNSGPSIVGSSGQQNVGTSQSQAQHNDPYSKATKVIAIPSWTGSEIRRFEEKCAALDAEPRLGTSFDLHQSFKFGPGFKIEKRSQGIVIVDTSDGTICPIHIILAQLRSRQRPEPEPPSIPAPPALSLAAEPSAARIRPTSSTSSGPPVPMQVHPHSQAPQASTEARPKSQPSMQAPPQNQPPQAPEIQAPAPPQPTVAQLQSMYTQAPMGPSGFYNQAQQTRQTYIPSQAPVGVPSQLHAPQAPMHVPPQPTQAQLQSIHTYAPTGASSFRNQAPPTQPIGIPVQCYMPTAGAHSAMSRPMSGVQRYQEIVAPSTGNTPQAGSSAIPSSFRSLAAPTSSTPSAGRPPKAAISSTTPFSYRPIAIPTMHGHQGGPMENYPAVPRRTPAQANKKTLARDILHALGKRQRPAHVEEAAQPPALKRVDDSSKGIQNIGVSGSALESNVAIAGSAQGGASLSEDHNSTKYAQNLARPLGALQTQAPAPAPVHVPEPHATSATPVQQPSAPSLPIPREEAPQPVASSSKLGVSPTSQSPANSLLSLPGTQDHGTTPDSSSQSKLRNSPMRALSEEVLPPPLSPSPSKTKTTSGVSSSPGERMSVDPSPASVARGVSPVFSEEDEVPLFLPSGSTPPSPSVSDLVDGRGAFDVGTSGRKGKGKARRNRAYVLIPIPSPRTKAAMLRAKKEDAARHKQTGAASSSSNTSSRHAATPSTSRATSRGAPSTSRAPSSKRSTRSDAWPVAQEEEDGEYDFTYDSLGNELSGEDRIVLENSCMRANSTMCKWAGCDAVLNSVLSLCTHLRKVHEPASNPGESVAFQCRWVGCWHQCRSKSTLKHFLKHAMADLPCPFANCIQTFRTLGQLRRHTDPKLREEYHHDVRFLKKLCKPIASENNPPPPPIPPAPVPSYMTVTRMVPPPRVAAEDHARAYPEIHRRIANLWKNGTPKPKSDWRYSRNSKPDNRKGLPPGKSWVSQAEIQDHLDSTRCSQPATPRLNLSTLLEELPDPFALTRLAEEERVTIFDREETGYASVDWDSLNVFSEVKEEERTPSPFQSLSNGPDPLLLTSPSSSTGNQEPGGSSGPSYHRGVESQLHQNLVRSNDQLQTGQKMVETTGSGTGRAEGTSSRQGLAPRPIEELVGGYDQPGILAIREVDTDDEDADPEAVAQMLL